MRKIISGRRCQSRGDFEFQINTANTQTGSSTATQFYFPIIDGTDKQGLNINFTIDWGDGVSSDIDSSNYSTDCLHTYSSSGIYDIKVRGSIAGFAFYSGGLPSGKKDSSKLIKIKNWGDLNLTGGANSTGFTGLGNAFRDCVNLTEILCSDVPTFVNGIPGVTPNHGIGARQMFSGCTNLTRIDNIANWEMKGVRNLNGMFLGCANWLFGGSGISINLSAWDVSYVYEFQNMFFGCTKGDFKLWDTLGGNYTGNIDCKGMFKNCANFVNGNTGTIELWGSSFSQVNNCQQMFYGARLFNRDISGWDTSGVTNMYQMFSTNSASTVMAFNQPIGSWDVSNVNDMRGMFTGCDNFDQNLSSWNVNAWSNNSLSTTPLTNSIGNFTLSTSNYNALLVAWDNYAFPSMPSGTVNFGNSTYSLISPGNSVANARTSLISKWGAISDGGGV